MWGGGDYFFTNCLPVDAAVKHQISGFETCRRHFQKGHTNFLKYRTKPIAVVYVFGYAKNVSTKVSTIERNNKENAENGESLFHPNNQNFNFLFFLYKPFFTFQQAFHQYLGYQHILTTLLLRSSITEYLRIIKTNKMHSCKEKPT